MRKLLLQIRVTEKERELFHRIAASEHKDLSDLIRDYLYRLADKKGIAA